MALRSRKEIFAKEEDKSIEINAQMQGSLIFKDPVNLKINGSFQGTLETSGSLTIGDKAHVEANITGDNIVIAGRVKGDITATKMLILMPTAVLRGNIRAPKLNIVEGAIFQGNCLMAEDLQSHLNIDEVAHFLEINVDEITRLAQSGKIPAIRAGDTWKFERGQIEHWAASAKINK